MKNEGTPQANTGKLICSHSTLSARLIAKKYDWRKFLG
jgi:hypothetical protein